MYDLEPVTFIGSVYTKGNFLGFVIFSGSDQRFVYIDDLYLQGG